MLKIGVPSVAAQSKAVPGPAETGGLDAHTHVGRARRSAHGESGNESGLRAVKDVDLSIFLA